MYRIFRKRGLKVIEKIGVLYLFLALGISFVSTIWAVYLESFFHNASSVGLWTSIFTVLGIFSYLLFIPLVERKRKTTLFFISVLFFAISYLIFSIFSSVYLVIILGALLSIMGSLRITTFGILVRDKSSDKEVSKNEGLIYTLLNLAWLVGPLVAGFIANKYGFDNVFFLGFLFVLISVLFFRNFKIKDSRRTKKVSSNVFKTIFGFFSKKDRVFTYLISGAINFWWALIFIYIPVYIVEQGHTASLVGLFLSATMLPLIFLEYHFGKIAGKKGFKKLFFIGFIILSSICILCFFISNIYLLLSLLVLASVGISMIESTSESYFFDIINEKQRDKYYGVYNTACDVGFLLGTLPAALLLLFFSFKSVFVLFAFFMLFFALISLRIREVYEFRRK